jgi:hypothetical protein
MRRKSRAHLGQSIWFFNCGTHKIEDSRHFLRPILWLRPSQTLAPLGHLAVDGRVRQIHAPRARFFSLPESGNNPLNTASVTSSPCAATSEICR